MTFEQLQTLISAGFTRDDMISLGILQASPAADPAADPAPAQAAEPEPAADPAPAGLNAEQALAALVTKLDARLDQIQAANITGVGMQTPDQKKTAEQILTELISPARKELI